MREIKMPRNGSIRTPLTILAISITLFLTLSHHLRHDLAYRSSSASVSSSSSSSIPLTSLSSPPPPPRHFLSPPPPPPLLVSKSAISSVLLVVQEENSSTPATSSSISSVSVLIPDWEVLVIASPDTPPAPGEKYTCFFAQNSSSPARFAAELPFGRGTAFKCAVPTNIRRRPQLNQPKLLRTDELIPQPERENRKRGELLKWNFLAYESFTTEHDVVLLAKGVNNRQGADRPAKDFRCVFGDDPSTAVKTTVTFSAQEVFRCSRPKLPENSPRKISVTLEMKENNIGVSLLPSIAQYAPFERRTVEHSEPKSLICACTMAYNVGKFLSEWVTYHARVGVEKFILYDNDSDDGLNQTVQYLNRAGFNIRTVYWPWPKTQEAGFSHCALYAEQICQWVAFLDVDEFILSPAWQEYPKPNPNMMSWSFLPEWLNADRVGQVKIKCVDFGPSNQTHHPVQGVTQGYTCRRVVDRRHKSIVMVKAIHPSLLNMVHHFKLKEGYMSKMFGKHRAIVNHYKYQAWPEFRTKFRRRVSAYVVDWREKNNLKSKDRAPGLGSEDVKPPGWAQRFCEKKDERLKKITRRWFGVNSTHMIWQS